MNACGLAPRRVLWRPKTQRGHAAPQHRLSSTSGTVVRNLVLLAAALAAICLDPPSRAAAAETRLAPTREQREFFENRIRPVLVDRCYECHSANARKIKGGLRLDSREGWMTGGESGPAIVPRDPDHSLLTKAIRSA